MSRSSASHRRWDGTRNGGRVLCLRKRDEYYHLDRGRREGSNITRREQHLGDKRRTRVLCLGLELQETIRTVERMLGIVVVIVGEGW